MLFLRFSPLIQGDDFNDFNEWMNYFFKCIFNIFYYVCPIIWAKGGEKLFLIYNFSLLLKVYWKHLYILFFYNIEIMWFVNILRFKIYLMFRDAFMAIKIQYLNLNFLIRYYKFIRFRGASSILMCPREF